MHLTRDQLRRIDRLAVERYHMAGIVLMENAARSVAFEACKMLDDQCCAKILVLCGGGNNGGDALAASRHLHNLGAEITIALLTDPAKFTGDARINWDIACAMKLTAKPFDPQMLADPKPLLILDGVFGTGLTQPPRDPFPHVARAVNDCSIPVLAIDLPSGMDADTGIPPGACIRATRTVTFVAEKIGFKNPGASAWLGSVGIGDIGCPWELIEEVAAGE